MKKKTQKALTFIFSAVVLVIVFLIVTLNTLIHKNRDNIRLEIQRTIGRTISFEDIQLNLWGGLGLSAKNLQITDDPRFAATPLIQTKEVRMQVRWLPLLLGRVEIKTVILGEPEIQVIKNETGNLNLFNLFVLPRQKRMGTGSNGSQGVVRLSPLAFHESGVKLSRGSVHYIDRSSKEPVEIRLWNLELDLKPVGLSREINIELSANFLNGDKQNLKIKGTIGPLKSVTDWNQSPVNLQMVVDAVPFLKLTSAVPFLKEKIPSYLDINGPLSLKMRVIGTLGQPQITGLTLTGSFFGSTAKNVTLTADLDLSQGLNEQTSMRGKIVVNPVTLSRLKKIPFVERMIPATLISKGPLSLSGEFEGNLQVFHIDARINADGSEIEYGRWFKKPTGIPAKMEIRAVRRKNRISFDKSTLSLHNVNLNFSGSLEEKPERLLRLQLQSDSMDLSGWNKLFIPASSYDMAGTLRLNLSLQKIFSPQRNDLNLQGSVNLDNLKFQNKKSGRAVEGITSQITFYGQEARIHNLSFRVGASDFTIQGELQNLAEPTFRYRLSTPKVNLADFTSLPEHQSDWIKELTSEGEIQIKNGTPTMQAHLRVGEGRLQEMPYHNLRGQISWSPERLEVKDMAFEALGGSFTGNGTWKKENAQWSRFTLDPVIQGMDLKVLLPHLSPELADGFEGRLDLNATLKGWGENWDTIKKTLGGKGKTEVKNGVFKDINLIRRVLSRVTGLPGVGNLISSTLSPRYGAIFKRLDTPYDTLGASFQVEDGRIRTSDLLLKAKDYSVQAKGWIGFDSSMGWNATLFLSPPFTKELMRNHKNIRFLVDKKGRLIVPFRLSGPLPKLEPKPDIKRLASLIQRGLMQAHRVGAGKGNKIIKKKSR